MAFETNLRSLATALASAVALVSCSDDADVAEQRSGGGTGGSSGVAGNAGAGAASGAGGSSNGGGSGAGKGGTAGVGEGGGGGVGGNAGDGGMGGGAGSGGSGIRIPECPGATERCDSERCTAGEPCVTCALGERCVEVEATCGPAMGITAQCIDDPCAGAELDCTCAAVVCEALGAFFCGVYGQSHFLVGPDREPFMSCASGAAAPAPE